MGKTVLKTAKESYDSFKKKIDDILSKRQKEFDETSERKELFSKIKGKPIDKKLLRELQEEFEKLGGKMKYDKESFDYCASREKVLGTEIEAITLGDDLILLNRKATKSAVYEELIHARQFKSGRYNEVANKHGNVIAENLMEKEAAEELIKNADILNIPIEETNQTIERLNYFINELKRLGYED